MPARPLLSLSRSLSWLPTSTYQQTLATSFSISGVGIHSSATSTLRLLPAAAGEGRYFIAGDEQTIIPARVESVADSALCTVLRSGSGEVRTVEHLLSALEAVGVDNVRMEIEGGNEIPILDGSSKQWIELIKSTRLCVAKNHRGQKMEKLAPKLIEPIHLHKNDSFIVAFPSSEIRITYGIDFPKVPAIGCQWFSFIMDENKYCSEIAPSRTFCIYEEVEKLREAGLIKGGSLENAIVCSMRDGWMNPPLRFDDEPCRHKILDLIGDFSLLARNGNRGLPSAHILAFKAGHSMHTAFVRRLLEI
ncbi:hypothetical protein LUZ60_005940 [Juncus effusus]|nr:hypothetical protein LUZ60_005940 [Juncus effusus]